MKKPSDLSFDDEERYALAGPFKYSQIRENIHTMDETPMVQNPSD